MQKLTVCHLLTFCFSFIVFLWYIHGWLIACHGAASIWDKGVWWWKRGTKTGKWTYRFNMDFAVSCQGNDDDESPPEDSDFASRIRNSVWGRQMLLEGAPFKSQPQNIQEQTVASYSTIYIWRPYTHCSICYHLWVRAHIHTWGGGGWGGWQSWAIKWLKKRFVALSP